ncbi:MAG: Anti-sigma-B factor antagonist [bacterium ADurb.Bin400]|nr:MAG: Anti-sigma-B factor antagonist [bacterium ADurb.Bin400]
MLVDLQHSYRRIGSADVVTLDGEIDFFIEEELREAVGRWVVPNGKVIVNLESVSYMDSSGIKLLLHCHREAIKCGCRLGLITPSDPARIVNKVLRTARLLEVFTVFPTVSEAVNAMEGNA